jgi:DNA-binding NtrC family response regulator
MHIIMKETVLIVEDELIVARDIRKTLERNGFRVAGVARTTEKALSMVEAFKPSLVLVDIYLKGNLTGIDLAKQLNNRGIPFIYVSANSNQQVLEAAKTTHPFGFIVKPFREKDLLVTIDIARYRYEIKKKMVVHDALDVESKKIVQTTETLQPAIRERVSSHCQNIIGQSAPLLHVFNLIQQVASFDTSVLILGESGTGKEGVANCIVQLSGRKNKPYIKINCAAIPAELIEAELFGYEKGAFTGALERKAGKFELATGGTILLDEIGEVSPEMQAKLLRVLQEKEIQRIGGSTVIKTDVRILASSSRILEKEVGEGKFRLDLYYRLLVFPVLLPPLRDRKEDIPLLIDHYIDYYAHKTGNRIAALSPDSMQKLLQYTWPGNVRQLQHLIERMTLLNNNAIAPEIEKSGMQDELPSQSKKITHTKTLEEMERDYILSVLKQCNFKVAGKGGAAEILNLPPTTLHSKIKKLGIRIDYE